MDKSVAVLLLFFLFHAGNAAASARVPTRQGAEGEAGAHSFRRLFKKSIVAPHASAYNHTALSGQSTTVRGDPDAEGATTLRLEAPGGGPLTASRARRLQFGACSTQTIANGVYTSECVCMAAMIALLS